MCGILWFGLALFWRMHNVPLPLQWVPYLPASLLSYGYRFVTAFLASIFLMGFAQKIFKQPRLLTRGLAYLGQISLGIYVLHIFIGRWIEDPIVVLCRSDMSMLFVCVDTLVKLAASVSVVVLIRRSKWISSLLLGK